MAFKPSNPDDPPRDRPFEDFRSPRTEKAKAVVADVLNQVQRYEHLMKLRKRKRKPNDQKTFETTVAAIVCDLAHRWITEPEGWVAVPLSKQVLSRASRYRSVALNKTLPDILKRLASPEMSFAELQKGFLGYFNNGRQSTIRAGKRLISRIEDSGLILSDFQVERSQEPIILKRGKEDYFDKAVAIEYQDNDTTRLYRKQMNRINDWLTTADIHLEPYWGLENGVTESDRFLRRIFNKSSFEKGGRLFGGFWQPLGEAQRFMGISIKGSRVVVLDYAQMAPRILYGLAGIQPPETDLYDLPLWSRNCRPGIKKIFNTLMFIDKPPDRMPDETRQYFKKSIKVHAVVDAIIKHHHPIAHLFFTEVGFQAMFIESQIMVDTLLTLMEHDIIGLPIHDAVIIAEGDRDEATEIMLGAFKRHAKVDGKVKLDQFMDFG